MSSSQVCPAISHWDLWLTLSKLSACQYDVSVIVLGCSHLLELGSRRCAFGIMT